MAAEVKARVFTAEIALNKWPAWRVRLMRDHLNKRR
jgi:hypothetical protein